MEKNRNAKGNAYQHAGKNNQNHYGSPINGDNVNGKTYVRCLDFNRDNMEQLVDKLCNTKYLPHRATIMNLLLKRIDKGADKYNIINVLNYFNQKIEKLKIKRANVAKNLEELDELVKLNETLTKLVKNTKSKASKIPPTQPPLTTTATSEGGNVNITINIEKFYNNNFYTTTTTSKKK